MQRAALGAPRLRRWRRRADRSSCRATAMTDSPAAASLRAMPRPRPRLPPVTTTLRIGARASLPVAATASAGTKRIAAGTLCCGQVVAAELQDLALEAAPARASRRRAASRSTTSATTIAPVIGFLRGRTSDMRTSRMAVDHRLDLLGMNLQAADIDDAAAAADEDSSGRRAAPRCRRCRRSRRRPRAPRRSPPTIADGGRGGADAQRAVLDLHLDVAARRPIMLAGKPSRPSLTSKPTPASVDA